MGSLGQLFALFMCAVSLGCTSTKHLFDAKKNADIRKLVICQYADIHARQIYRERSLGYSMVRYSGRPTGDGAAMAGVSAGVGAGVGVWAGAAGLAGPGFVAGSALMMSSGLVMAGIENSRTEFLNRSITAPDPQNAALTQIVAGLKAEGYSSGPTLALKHNKVRASEPFKIGESLPDLDSRNWKRAFPAHRPGDAVLIVNVLNFGLQRVGGAFKETRHIAFIVVGVKMYRADRRRLVHEATYVATANSALPHPGELKEAIADPRVVQAGYDEALNRATEMIVTDLGRRTVTIQEK
jgi:hypothetical protein